MFDKFLTNELLQEANANRKAALQEALNETYDDFCRRHGGVDDEGNGQYVMGHEGFAALAKELDVDAPVVPDDKTVTLYRRNGGILAKVNGKVDGFNYAAGARIGTYLLNTDRFPEKSIAEEVDSLIRATQTECGKLLDLRFRNSDDRWIKASDERVHKWLVSRGVGPEATQLTGMAFDHAFTEKVAHFQSEWDEANRVHNVGAQLACEPRQGDHPMYDFLWDHIGSYLTPYLKHDPWFAANGILTGGDYLRVWCKSMIVDSTQSLPMPLLFSEEQNQCGKTMFRRSICWFFKPIHPGSKKRLGAKLGYKMLVDDYNDGLKDSLFVFLDDKPVASSIWNHKLKDWIDSDTIEIRPMRIGAYDVVNCTHWLLTSNSLNAIEFTEADRDESRVLFIEVPPIPDDKRKEFDKGGIERMMAEVPTMLHTLLHNVKLPTGGGRLCLPVPKTDLRAKMLGVDAPVKRLRIDSPSDAISMPHFIDKHFDRDANACVLANVVTAIWKQATNQGTSQEKLKVALEHAEGCHGIRLRQRIIDGKKKRVVTGIRQRSA